MTIPPIKIIGISIILCLSGSWHYGYELTSVNPTEQIFKEFINQTHYGHYGRRLSNNGLLYVWSFILNVAYVGALIGTVVSSKFMEKFGRKRLFYLTTSLCSVGPLLSGLAYSVFSWELFAIGRVISGIGFGISMCLQPTYLTEITATEYSGCIGATTGVLVEFGFMFGSIAAMPIFLGTSRLWPFLQYLELIPNLLCFAILPFLPESPKFIMAKSGDRKLAIESLIFFKHKNINNRMTRIVEEIEIEKKAVGVRQLFKKPYLRKGVTLTCVIQFALCFSGVGPLGFYSSQLITKVGASENVAALATSGMASLCFTAAILSCLFVDKLGRKILLIGAMIVLTLLDVIFAICAYINHATSSEWSRYACIAAIVLFLFVFGLGPSTVQWFLAAELMPQNARSSAIMVTMVVQWVCLTLQLFLYDALKIIFQEWSFFLFIISLGVSSAYLLKALPETKNKDSVEIIKMLGYIGDEVSNQKDIKEIGETKT